jgi:NADH-quinone oxidoreductase subunit I
VLYPFQKKPISVDFRGEPILRLKVDGSEKCNGCKKCESICPVRAIEVIVKNEGKTKTVTEFTVDLNKCIFCGMCESHCLQEAIAFVPNFEYAKLKKKELIYNKTKLLQNGERWEYSVRVKSKCKQSEEQELW